jgi:hypothetical protein
MIELEKKQKIIYSFRLNELNVQERDMLLNKLSEHKKAQINLKNL